MTDIRDRHRQEFAVGRRVALAFAVILAGPIVAGAAMAGQRLGLWPYDVAWNILTLMVALPLTLIGAVAALYVVVLGVRLPKIAGIAALAAVVVTGATLALFVKVLMLDASAAGPDVSTDPSDPPGFPAELIAAGAPGGAPRGGPTQNAECAVQAHPSQSAPGVAGYALQQAGFDVASLGVGRAVGSKTGSWFGTTWDA
ncbi:MAG: hypothetical protein JWR59_1623, partial [Brevundimonas sp.]|nr:hypothetical protein [Brevundimonas sp.]